MRVNLCVSLSHDPSWVLCLVSSVLITPHCWALLIWAPLLPVPWARYGTAALASQKVQGSGRMGSYRESVCRQLIGFLTDRRNNIKQRVLNRWVGCFSLQQLESKIPFKAILFHWWVTNQPCSLKIFDHSSLLPHCRRIKLFLSAVSWLILFGQCSSFSGRGVSQIYSFHYPRLQLLMMFMLAAGGWGKALLCLNSQAPRIPCTRHWTCLQPHTLHKCLFHWLSVNNSLLIRKLWWKTQGFSSAHLTQAKLVFSMRCMYPKGASRICSFPHRTGVLAGLIPLQLEMKKVWMALGPWAVPPVC